jgi:glycosyltransferase involved in cell wall biosynthesis
MIRILLVTQSEHTGLTYHRQLVPHLHLERNYEGYEVIPCHDIESVSDEELNTFNIVSFLRLVDWKFRTQDFIFRCKKAGCKVIIDIDDYWFLHPQHELNKAYLDNKIAEQTIVGLELADYVTTTTEHFASEISKINKNVCVLPNSIDPFEKQFYNEKTYSDRLRFGWIGGVYHIPDVRLMMEGFKEVFKTVNNNKFQLCLGGFNINDSYRILELIYTDSYKNIKDKEYLNYLKLNTQTGSSCAEMQPYKRLWGKSVFEYAKLYNEIDVALIPLISNKFNSFKSQIKIIEAGWFKKPIIVSSTMPYTIDCNKSNSIMVSASKNNEGWGTAIKSMIHNESRREDLTEKLYELVIEKYTTDTVNIVRNQLYQSLCE